MIASPGAPPAVRMRMITRVAIAAGKAIPKLALNLSLMAQPLSVAGGNGGIGDKGKIVSNMAPPDRADT